MENIESYKKRIRNALKSNGSYSKEMDIAILMCASSLQALDLAQSDIEDLSSCYVEEVSREGHLKLVPHPAFKVLKDAGESVRRGLRELGLTLGTLSGGDDDEVTELTNKVNRARQ